jgi:hypothetical protein
MSTLIELVRDIRTKFKNLDPRRGTWPEPSNCLVWQVYDFDVTADGKAFAIEKPHPPTPTNLYDVIARAIDMRTFFFFFFFLFFFSFARPALFHVSCARR